MGPTLRMRPGGFAHTQARRRVLGCVHHRHVSQWDGVHWASEPRPAREGAGSTSAPASALPQCAAHCARSKLRAGPLIVQVLCPSKILLGWTYMSNPRFQAAHQRMISQRTCPSCLVTLTVADFWPSNIPDPTYQPADLPDGTRPRVAP